MSSSIDRVCVARTSGPVVEDAPAAGRMSRAARVCAVLVAFARAVFSSAAEGVSSPTEDARCEQRKFVKASDIDCARARFVGADTRADVAAVVVTHNSAPYIGPLIDDLRVAALDRPMRVVVVDNQSSDGTADMVRAHSDIKLVVSSENLGYAGGINAALPFTDPCAAVLILNPDLELAPEAVTRLRAAADADNTGAVVPLMLDADGSTFVSLRREPSVTRAVGDALLGGKVRARPSFLSEIDWRPTRYLQPHDVDWATGATVLIPAAVGREVGEWNEEFFLYSEETDYFRRVRESGRRIRFQPSAVVKHLGKGSGTSRALAVLMVVNRIRYIEQHHGHAYSLLFRMVVALAEGLRSYDTVHRRKLAFVLNRPRWQELPHALKQIPSQPISGPHQRGAAIVSAYKRF